jgi:hypothetical protein
MPTDGAGRLRPIAPPMPFDWCIALSGLRHAVDRLLGSQFSRPASLPPEVVSRLHMLRPELKQAPGGRMEYRVPLVAPMKAGKSTLLNAVLCQDLLPARGPAMTVLPTRVALWGRDAMPQPRLTLDAQLMKLLSELAARLATPGQQDAIARATSRFELLKPIASSVGRWQQADTREPVLGNAAVRGRLSEINDLLRLALTVLPGDGVTAQVQQLSAPRVDVSVPWLETAPIGGLLVLVDTPGPDEDLQQGVLNGLVTTEVALAHEILVVADATRLGNTSEESVRHLIEVAQPWRGRTGRFVAVNRADDVRDLRAMLSSSPGARELAAVPELRAIWLRLAEDLPQADPRLTLTSARAGLAAAGVLWPELHSSDQKLATREFLKVTRPADWEDAIEDAADPGWLLPRARDTWAWSGISDLQSSFVGLRAREPGRMAVRVLLDRLAAALGPLLESAREPARPSGALGALVTRMQGLAQMVGTGA